MKFLVFSDFHHHPKCFMAGTKEDLDIMFKCAQETGCDFMIHAGDFCHGPLRPEVTECVEYYNNLPIPTYHCLGNHDCDWTPFADTLKTYRMPHNYYFFDCKGYRFIVLDPNYFYKDGEYCHYDGRDYFALTEYRDFVPPEQLKWLEETLEASPYPAVLISHESFERDANGVQNRQEVRDILNRANKKRPGSVLMCMNGHYHRDNLRIMDNILWYDMNSTRMEYVNIPHNFYPQELMEKYSHLKNNIVYNDPVYTIVTLEGNTVTLEGVESSFFMGFRRSDIPGEYDCDPAGRPCLPKSSSAKITLG